MWESNEKNKQTKAEQIHRYRGQTWFPEGRAVKERAKKGERIERYKLLAIK